MYPNNVTFNGFKGADPLFTHKKDSKGKSGYLGRIFSRYETLMGAAGVMDG